jgi:hypothetical protein
MALLIKRCVAYFMNSWKVLYTIYKNLSLKFNKFDDLVFEPVHYQPGVIQLGTTQMIQLSRSGNFVFEI